MNLIDLFLKEGKQYLMDAMPGGALNREVTPQGLLDATALATAPVPVVGDVAGLAADAKRMYDNPAERTPMNIGLSALGLLPFIPGATVFHGTPHLFNKFDSSKIGTGEGAQAFGHGLYLAENPAVAQNYAVTTTNYKPVLDGKPVNISSPKTAADRAIKEFANNRGDASRAMQMLGITEDKKALKWLKENYKRLSTESGNLMQVDLPDEQIAKMLDWDKPLSQQPKSVQEAVRPIIEQTAKSFPSVRDNQQLTGYGLYKAYQGHRGGNPVAASESLRAAGIPGIRYLDESSRDISPLWVVENKGFGAWDFPSKTDAEDFMRNNPQLKTNLIPPQKTTSNFVVFPGMEDMLRIEQINSQPVESLFRSLGR